MKLLLLVCTVGAAVATLATTQPIEGRVAFCTTAGVYHSDDALVSQTLFLGAGIGGLRLHSLKTASGNGGVIGGDTSGRVFRISSSGTIATLTTAVGSWATSMDLNQDGQYVLGTSTSGVVRMSTSGGRSILNWLGGATVNGLCRNLGNGHIAVTTTSPGDYLIQIDQNNVPTTLATFAASLGFPT